MIQKYQIPKFTELTSLYKFSDQKAKHAAESARSYYHFSYYQMIKFTDTYVVFYQERDPGHDRVMSALYESWSYAFGMYVLLRTVIEAVHIMRRMIGDTAKVSDYYKTEIERIINIANDLIKHPTFKTGSGPSQASEPNSLGMNGEIDIVVWSDSTSAPEVVELHPSADFYIVQNYLEHVAERLMARPQG